MKTTRITKTIRQWIEHRKGISEWFESTQELFNQVAAFYFGVIQVHPGVLDLPAKESLTALERLTHATKRNPDPVMPLSNVASNIPAMFRRAAIRTALGSARSFQTSLRRWRREKEKATQKGRAFHKRPPVPPRRWNRSVTLYKGMWQQRSSGRITLKLWDGQTWRWVRFRLSGRGIPEGWQTCSPQVIRRGQKWWLHTPIQTIRPLPAKAKDQVQSDSSTRICAVDLNINDALAVCTILEADGTADATRFIRGGRHLHGRRKSLLGRVAHNRGQTGLLAESEQDNTALWAKIRHLDEDTAHRISRRIVQFAQEHGATIVVFEHLGRYRPERGRYSRRANSKRSYWLRGRIFRYTRYKAWEAGLLTCRVSPRDTSRRCAVCGEAVARYGEEEGPTGYRPGAPLVYCQSCQMRGSADRNASLNIGRRLLARYLEFPQEKPLARPDTGRSPKGEGGPIPQDAESGGRPHAEPARQGERVGHGTAQRESPGAAGTPESIPSPLRPHGLPQAGTSGGYATSTQGAAYAGVHKEAAGL